LSIQDEQELGFLKSCWPSVKGNVDSVIVFKIEDQTVRERVRVSIGGAQICLRLSNEYGSAALLIDSATVAAPNDPTNVRPGSIQTVTFGGRNSVTIPKGAPVLRNREPVIGVIL